MPHFTTSDNMRIYFEDAGTGLPVLCLAGLTRTVRDFDFVAPHLAQYRMIAMDYRGRGQSDFDSDYSNYNILRESQDVVELLDHLGLEKVNILGTSRGGLIAMALAASHPARLSCVILNDVGPVIDPNGLALIMTYVGKRPAAKTYDEAATGLQSVMEARFPGVSLERWRTQAENQYLETPDGLQLRYDPKLRDALLDQSAAGPAPDLWPLFAALRDIPTGLIRGQNSDLLSPDTLVEMHQRHPGLRSVEIPDRGHVPFLDEPQAVDLIHTILETS
ncbi:MULTISPECIES: alpha/beta fold hydrolase [unclassified Ruegeria]|uniref:alpha/beta fold hydrolase n=1 Tax=unclassified Ruegeria TaxID=2625375 RepID=UPI001488B0E8|nr:MULTISPECIES: alpha/beta hydrolase [unclassified Ruegeria]